MKIVKTQYHIDSNGELFPSNKPHPYTTKSKKDLEKIISTYLKGSKYKIRKTPNEKTFYISRNGIPFLEVILSTSDGGGKEKHRKIRVPFSSKTFITNLRKDTPKDLLIISPYSSVEIRENGKLIPHKDAFLIMNRSDMCKSGIGETILNALVENISPTNFSTSSRWFDIETIKDSIFTNRITQNNAKNLSCVPAKKLISFLNTSWTAYSSRSAKRKDSTTTDKKGYAKAAITGLMNEKIYYTKLLEEPDFLEIANSQYCEPGDRIVHISHTGGDKTMSIYNKPITQKTDFRFITQNGNRINVSLKKKLEAYLHEPTVEKFFVNMEDVFGIIAPASVKEITYLFFHAPNEPYYDNILTRYATHPDEIRKRRLFEEHLREYDETKVEEMLNWFSEYQNAILEFMAVRGNMAAPEEFVTHLAFVDTETLEGNMENWINKVIPVDALFRELEQINIPVTFNPAGTQLKFVWGSIENHSNLFHTRILEKRIEKTLGNSFINNGYISASI